MNVQVTDNPTFVDVTVTQTGVSIVAEQTFRVEVGASEITVVGVGIKGDDGARSYAELTGRPVENSLTVQGALNIEETVTDTPSVFNLLSPVYENIGVGLSSWYNQAQSRFRPNAPLTTYLIRASVKARPASMVQLPTIVAELDISALGDGSQIVTSDEKTLRSADFKTINFYFVVYAKTTFFNNGGQITLRTIDGSAIIKNPTLFIEGK
jgi:hypothetical protein